MQNSGVEQKKKRKGEKLMQFKVKLSGLYTMLCVIKLISSLPLPFTLGLAILSQQPPLAF